jgi:pimeloyl-ACP methyl ester carboxylesterase
MAPENTTIVSQTAKPGDVALHYLMAGHGPAVILLHGFTQTSRVWRPLMSALAGKRTVIAPDLPGFGDSDIPPDGLDMKNAAIRVHALAKSLGVEKAAVAGHDIGMMIAYAYAALFRTETEKLVLMDAQLPGIAGSEHIYDRPGMWHARFNGPTAEALVAGREGIYLEHFWNDFVADKARSVPEADRQAYIAAYSRPGRMRAGWGYFESMWSQTAKDFEEFSKTRLTIPVLSVGSRDGLGPLMGQQAKLVASDVTVVLFEDTRHWLMDENPKETIDALEKFLLED